MVSVLNVRYDKECFYKNKVSEIPSIAYKIRIIRLSKNFWLFTHPSQPLSETISPTTRRILWNHMVTSKVPIPNHGGHVHLDWKWSLVSESSIWCLAGPMRFSALGIWNWDTGILSHKLWPWRTENFPWYGRVWITCNEAKKTGWQQMKDSERK